LSSGAHPSLHAAAGSAAPPVVLYTSPSLLSTQIDEPCFVFAWFRCSTYGTVCNACHAHVCFSSIALN
jgi:hypothetical protein